MKRSEKLTLRDGDVIRAPEMKSLPPREDMCGGHLVRIYNATKDDLDELMYGGASGLRQKIEKLFWTLLPHGLRTVDHHAQHFRGIVDRWLTGTLRDEDHEDIAIFVLNQLGPKSHLGQTYLRLNPSFIKRYILGQFKKNPLEPMTMAYWDLHLLMAAEEEGKCIFRPRHCEWCNRLYLPVRKALQKTCSPKCSRLIRYKRYMDRQVASRDSWHQSVGGKEEVGYVKPRK